MTTDYDAQDHICATCGKPEIKNNGDIYRPSFGRFIKMCSKCVVYSLQELHRESQDGETKKQIG